jgi:hypothetical protein
MDLAQNSPPPTLALSNGSLNHHHHLIPHTYHTPFITSRHCFQWHTQNRALAARFQSLEPKPPSLAHIVEWPPKPPPPHSPYSKSPLCHLPLPFVIVHPKLSHGGSILLFYFSLVISYYFCILSELFWLTTSCFYCLCIWSLCLCSIVISIIKTLLNFDLVDLSVKCLSCDHQWSSRILLYRDNLYRNLYVMPIFDLWNHI